MRSQIGADYLLNVQQVREHSFYFIFGTKCVSLHNAIGHPTNGSRIYVYGVVSCVGSGCEIPPGTTNLVRICCVRGFIIPFELVFPGGIVIPGLIEAGVLLGLFGVGSESDTMDGFLETFLLFFGISQVFLAPHMELKNWLPQ